MAGPASSVSGKSWDCWPADDAAADECSLASSSGSSSTVSSGTATPIGNPSSPSQTPLLVRRHHPSSSDDVMKLPRKDMKIFGEFPGRDDFLLVLCDTCHRYVKSEAFEAHCRQRHDFVGKQGGGRASAASVAAAAAASASTRGKAAQLRSCTVELTKEDLFPLSSSSSSATTAETSAATTMVSSPAPSLTKEEPMDESSPVVMVNPVSESRTTLAPPTPMEEADSTTANNVISIPDTGDPLPAMSNELMAMVSGEPVILPKSEAPGPNAPGGVDSTSVRVGGGGGKRGPAAAFQISPHSVIKLQINPPPPPPPPPPPALPTQPNPPSPAANKKASPGKKAASLLAVGAGVGGGAGGRQDRRALQREYNPDKHCGVWDNESKRHCTRALTCKSHSVLLKRNIQGRSKSFDDLVQEHKAQKEAQQAAAAALAGAAAAAASTGPAPLRTTSRPPPGVLANAESVLSSITEPNPIDPRFSIPTNTNGIRIKSGSSSSPYVPPVASGAKMTAVSTNLNGSKKSLLCLSSPPSKESDENVIYTTDHPKPLAVCTFGGRRVGGLLVTDRSQFLTRKVVRVAISAGGFHRIRPASRLNELKFGNNVIRRPGASGGGASGGTAVPTNARIVTAAPGMAATANNYLVNYNLAPTAVVQAAGQALPQQPAAVATASAAAAAAARVMTSVTVAGGGTSTSVAPTSLAIAPQIGRVAVNLAPLPPNAVVATSALPPGINIATTSDATFKTELQDFKGGIKFELGRNMKPILPTSSDIAK